MYCILAKYIIIINNYTDTEWRLQNYYCQYLWHICIQYPLWGENYLANQLYRDTQWDVFNYIWYSAWKIYLFIRMYKFYYNFLYIANCIYTHHSCRHTIEVLLIRSMFGSLLEVSHLNGGQKNLTSLVLIGWLLKLSMVVLILFHEDI